RAWWARPGSSQGDPARGSRGPPGDGSTSRTQVLFCEGVMLSAGAWTVKSPSLGPHNVEPGTGEGDQAPTGREEPKHLRRGARGAQEPEVVAGPGEGGRGHIGAAPQRRDLQRVGPAQGGLHIAEVPALECVTGGEAGDAQSIRVRRHH